MYEDYDELQNSFLSYKEWKKKQNGDPYPDEGSWRISYRKPRYNTHKSWKSHRKNQYRLILTN